MKSIILLVLLTGLCFLLFVTSLILGFIKKNRHLKLVALVSFLIFSGLSIVTIIQAFDAFHRKLTAFFEPRSGGKIYEAVFDKKQSDCVKVIRYRDQIIPLLDDAIWLYFETCPQELKRILSQHPYETNRLPSANFESDIPEDEHKKWFVTDSFGDSVMLYQYISEDNRIMKTIWASSDSTKVLYRDW